MDKRQKETLGVRIVSVGISILAFAVFKPMGLDGLGWMVYVHLMAIWMLGVGICYVTEAILKYMVHMPASLNKGIDYILRRNLRFQFINTPLMALMMCVYFHFPMNAKGLPSLLTWEGYFTMLVIIAFCSFILGLYWRNKFLSRYLAAELEETKELNEQLKQVQTQSHDAIQPSSKIVLTGTTSETVNLQIPDLLYIEAVGNYVKIHQWRDGQVHTDMLRATSKQMADDLQAYPMIVRCHRAFLVNLGQVGQIVAKSGSMQLHINHCHDSIPVSRSNMATVTEAIKAQLQKQELSNG